MEQQYAIGCTVGCELFPENDTVTAVKAIMAVKAAVEGN